MPVILCLLTLASCGENSKTEAANKAQAGVEAIARKAVLAVLKDPESARFGTFTLAGPPSPSGKQGACLVVNAKNAFGGYTGDQVAYLFRAKPDQPWQVFDIDKKLSYEQCLQLMDHSSKSE